mgnify:CR=1 FL=1
MKFQSVVLMQFFLCAFFHSASAAEAKKAITELRYEVIAQHPHDVRDFTQGLLLLNGRLLESVGHYGRSALVEKDLRSGKVLRRVSLEGQYFGEGITAFKDRIYQLSWLNGIGFIYDTALRPQKQFTYSGEGWGLTHDGKRLILSDGSSTLRFLDPITLQESGRTHVHDHGNPVPLLNELEFARKRIWANVWHSDRVAAINPDSGAVEAWLDLSGLRQRFEKPAGWDEREHVLNGIAYDPRSNRFLVTGKCWPILFEILVSPTSN